MIILPPGPRAVRVLDQQSFGATLELVFLPRANSSPVITQRTGLRLGAGSETALEMPCRESGTISCALHEEV